MIWSSSLTAVLGNQVHTSAWRTIAQERILCFAKATDDFQFVHTDPKRAARETPFGGTIAHGFLTLSMISTLTMDIMPVLEETKAIVLVSAERIKFMSAVKSGSRIRGLFRIDREKRLSYDKILIRLNCIIEIENEPKPAMSCDLSWMLLRDQSSAGADLLAHERQSA